MARNFTGLEIVMKVKPFCGDGRGDGMVMAMYMLERSGWCRFTTAVVVVSVKRKERRGKRERERRKEDVSFCFFFYAGGQKKCC